MKKKLLYLLAVSMLFVQSANIALSKTRLSNPVRVAIHKYKTGNYTGCLQDCKNIVYHDPTNAVAYYYLAMSYAKAGDKDNAVKYYSKVLSLSPNQRLSDYAKTGKRCLETPDKCHDDGTGGSADPDLDKFMAKDLPVSDKVQQGFQERALKNIQYDINKGKDLDPYELNQIKQRSDIETGEKIAQNKPTDAEIVKALRVLQDAGLSSYVQQPAQQQPSQVADPQAAMMNPYMQAASYPQNPEMAQISAMLNQGNSNNNNQMMNMLPYMMMQNKDGTSNYSPQLMQAVMMNSMMPNLNFDTDKDK